MDLFLLSLKGKIKNQSRKRPDPTYLVFVTVYPSNNVIFDILSIQFSKFQILLSHALFVLFSFITLNEYAIQFHYWYLLQNIYFDRFFE